MLNKVNIIKTIVVEDSIETQKYLESVVSQYLPQLEIMSMTTSIQSTIAAINTINPELILMDIELDDGYSFEIFEKINHQNFEVIFITAFNDMMQTALEHYAFNYLTKPIDEKKLISTIQRYIQLKNRLYSKQKQHLLNQFLSSKNSKLLIHSGQEHVYVEISEIIKCEADGNFTHFYLKSSKKLLASKPLKYFETLLQEKGFFKAHRSVIININCISSIYKKETIILCNNDKVHVSLRNKSKLSGLIDLLS